MSLPRTLFPFLFIASLFICIGCGDGRPADLPPLYRASITFTQEGTPLEGATIMLIPETDSKWSVGGVTDANGLCRLRTHGQFDGAPEGKYKIVVIKDIMEIPEPDTNAPVSIGMDGLPSALGVLYALVDAQFSNVNTTPLTVTITRSGAEPSTFDLGAPVRIRQ